MLPFHSYSLTLLRTYHVNRLIYAIFTKALWSRYPFTASSTIVPIDNPVVTSTTPTITPSMRLQSLKSSEATLSNHCLRFLHSSTYLKLICRADGFTRHQHPLWCDFPPIIPPHASPFSAPSSKCPMSFRTASSIVSTNSLLAQFPDNLRLFGTYCEELSPLDGM